MTATAWFRLGALVVLLGMLGALLLLWPLPALGFDVDPATGSVQAVEASSPVAQAGIRPGDRITMIYGYPWPDVNHRLLRVPLPWRATTPTPITVVRDGAVRDFVVRAGAPAPGLQVEKLVRALIALVCWGTGYLLGTSPRAAEQHLRRVAWFWVLLGGSLMLYGLTALTSYLLTIGVLWVQSTVLAPVAVAIHAWYPQRPTTPQALRRVRQTLLTSILVAQVTAITLVLAAPSASVAYVWFETATTVAFLASFVLSAAVLWRAYQQASVGHLRRQIRLIGAACLLVGGWTTVLILLMLGNPAMQARIPPAALPLGAVLIPLAYVLGGVSADLMRLDQIVRRIVVHTLTFLLIVNLLVLGGRTGLLVVTPALVILLALALYAPWYRAIQRQLGPGIDEARAFAALREAERQISISLEQDELVALLATGVQRAFLHPPLAIYTRGSDVPAALACRADDRVDAPATLGTTLFHPWRTSGAVVLTASMLQERLGQQPLDPVTAGLVFHPTVAVWGLMHQQRGKLVGVVMIGARGDHDPYQPDDLRELERLLRTAALALTTSASYAAYAVVGPAIRALYRHLQQAEERAAVELANDLHDQVSNIHVQKNVEILEQLVATTQDPWVRKQLGVVLQGEATVRELLRMACEELKPTGIEEPLGLSASLRQQQERVQAHAELPVTLRIEHPPQELDEQLRRALLRITREALTNAVKHGQPTRIAMVLRYPATPADTLVLSIENDGLRPSQPIAARPGHWGVRNMQEYADAIGATIRWTALPEGGTRVTVVVPATVLVNGPPREPLLTSLPSWADPWYEEAHEDTPGGGSAGRDGEAEESAG